MALKLGPWGPVANKWMQGKGIANQEKQAADAAAVNRWQTEQSVFGQKAQYDEQVRQFGIEEQRLRDIATENAQTKLDVQQMKTKQDRQEEMTRWEYNYTNYLKNVYGITGAELDYEVNRKGTERYADEWSTRQNPTLLQLSTVAGSPMAPNYVYPPYMAQPTIQTVDTGSKVEYRDRTADTRQYGEETDRMVGESLVDYRDRTATTRERELNFEIDKFQKYGYRYEEARINGLISRAVRDDAAAQYMLGPLWESTQGRTAVTDYSAKLDAWQAGYDQVNDLARLYLQYAIQMDPRGAATEADLMRSVTTLLAASVPKPGAVPVDPNALVAELMAIKNQYDQDMKSGFKQDVAQSKAMNAFEKAMRTLRDYSRPPAFNPQTTYDNAPDYEGLQPGDIPAYIPSEGVTPGF
jgi:hypothetical protein